MENEGLVHRKAGGGGGINLPMGMSPEKLQVDVGPRLGNVAATTPSPSKMNYDRFIPSRSSSNLSSYALLEKSPNQPKDESGALYSMLLRSELLGEDTGVSLSPATPDKNFHRSPSSCSPNKVLRFKSDGRSGGAKAETSLSLDFGTPGVSSSTSPIKRNRKIPKGSFKVLDAPNLQDDFYLNLVDWSKLNVLAVGLGNCVYLWSASTSKVTKLCDLGQEQVCSVAWTSRGNYVAVGSSSGELQIWDAVQCSHVRTMLGHSSRVGTLAWGSGSLSSGSRDKTILNRDVRSSGHFTNKLLAHKSEVCGLKWSFDDRELASGGNDNQLLVWNAMSTQPVCKFYEHTAAVKAIAWSPHQSGLLASGGGTADKCIRFWNTSLQSHLNCVDTGGQVCNLMWSQNVNELVSTHGYSQNQVIVWRYPTMSKVAVLTGHSYRVLFLAMSPDGQTIVTGAGDETLRFWNVFPSKVQVNSRDSGIWSMGRAHIR